jgi:hypothetical protein
MKTIIALCILAFPLLTLAAPPKVAYEMVNKVNGVVVSTDILVKEGDKCKVYSKDLHETFITIYSCKLDATKFQLAGQRHSSCYAESSGQAPIPTADAVQQFSVKQSSTSRIEMKSHESEADYEVTVTLKKIDLVSVSQKIGDSQCIL